MPGRVRPGAPAPGAPPAVLSRRSPDPRGWARWWVYQRERFPVVAHAPLIAAFSLGALAYAARLRSGPAGAPTGRGAVVAFATALLFFLQLRIADEHKDREEDARWRPYRAVPRGLVSLPELARLGAAAAAVQLALGWWLTPAMLPVLACAWIYLALMSREFFVRAWLTARPITYLWTHMLIMPIVDFYVTACDWRPAGAWPAPGLAWFLAASFFNGCVLEIGRKIRAPADEERGVNTYSRLWGRPAAVGAWWGVLFLSGVCAAAAGGLTGSAGAVAAVLGTLLAAAALVGVRFLRRPAAVGGRAFEAVSGLWTLGLYGSTGLWPWLAQAWGITP